MRGHPVITRALAFAGLTFALQAQSPLFEVASIHPNQAGGRASVISTPGGRIVATNETLKYLIQFAFDLRDEQISGGPPWLGSATYDIAAKPERPLNPSPDNINEFRLMLRALLIDRFHLTFRRETKESSVYALVVAKTGSKLEETEKWRAPSEVRLSGTRGVLVGQKVDAALLARALSDRVGRTVRDTTGLTGYYNFRLEWAPEESEPKGPDDGNGVPDAAGPSIYTAIQEQLGVRLESQKAPIEVLVIEHAEKPSDN